MVDFKKYQNSWVGYGKLLFCAAFENMSLWIIFQIKSDFFVFFKINTFCDKFTDLIFEDQLLINF